MPWTQRTLSLPDGQQINALHGTGTAADQPTLVLLHEALGCIRMWKDYPQRLAAATGLDIFVYERLGYGGSSAITLPRPDDYLVREGQQRLPQVLDAAGLERVILVGHSDGGSVALVGAACAPDRIEGVVTEAAHIYVDPLTVAGIEKAVALYNSSDLPQRLARYHGERTDLLFRAWSETWLRPSYRQGFDLRPWLADIRCPALIMQGVADHYGVPEQVTDICAGIGTRATACFLPDCGHVPHLEATDACLDATVRFIAAARGEV